MRTYAHLSRYLMQIYNRHRPLPQNMDIYNINLVLNHFDLSVHNGNLN